MNFTREPIIESIISARDGYKLSIKSTKLSDPREILVDAVEVVSYGNTLFFRCQEKPKPFFFPVGDYEVAEVKETRFVLKNSTPEKSVKIQSAKEHLHKTSKEQVEEEEFEISEDVSEESVDEVLVPVGKEEKKSKRNRRKRDRQKQQRQPFVENSTEEVFAEEDKGGDNTDEALVSSPTSASPKFISPPPALIISTLSHRKSEAVHQEPVLPNSPLELADRPLEEIHLEANPQFVEVDAEKSSLETSREV